MTGPDNSIDPSVDLSLADEARRWVVRLDELTPIEHKRLERWLKEDETNREAFADAQREWQSLEFLKLLRGNSKGDPWVAKRRVRRNRNRRYALPLAAAAAVTAMAVAIGWSLLPSQTYEVEYFTAVGEQEEVSLPDGSSIILNTNTRLNVQYSNRERNVFLAEGEAHFDVAHDTSRPFVVYTDVGAVRAVGTAFTVYVHDEQAEVTVTEGLVEVSKAPESLMAAIPSSELPDNRAGPAVPVQTLARGHNATLSETIETVAVAEVDTEVLERKLAWQYGMLEFVNTPLGDVIDEVGRYTSRNLIIEDPELEDYPVTIIARTDNIDGLLSNLDISTDAISVTYPSSGDVRISTSGHSAHVQ